MNRKFSLETLVLAFCIALLPPIWAVLAPYIGVNTGAVALICAGLYVTNGNKISDALKITLGFLLGDFWAWLVIQFMQVSPFGADATTFIALFVLGGAAVLISSKFENITHCAAWLCGWAIGLTVMIPLDIAEVNSYALQIAAAMIVGVWYVGALLDKIHQTVVKFLSGR